MANTSPKRYDTENPIVPALPLSAQIIVTSDTDEYTHPITIEVHVAGALKVVPFRGDFAGADTAITIPAGVAVAGYIVPYRVKKVFATGTAATVCGIF